MKPCTRCRKTKPLDEFIRNNSTPDGRTATCKICTRQVQQLRRNKKVKDEETRRKREIACPSDKIMWPATTNPLFDVDM